MMPRDRFMASGIPPAPGSPAWWASRKPALRTGADAPGRPEAIDLSGARSPWGGVVVCPEPGWRVVGAEAGTSRLLPVLCRKFSLRIEINLSRAISPLQVKDAVVLRPVTARDEGWRWGIRPKQPVRSALASLRALHARANEGVALTAEQSNEQEIGELTLGDPITSVSPLPYPVPEPDQKWDLPGGFAWVYYGEGSDGVQRPVVMADGFNLGKSDLAVLYAGLDRDYPLITKLRQQRRTVVLLGFEERTDSILTNAKAAQEAILRTIAERIDDTPLAVGGFSMGGLITRYALANLERQRMDHQTQLYFSYDTPHRGGLIPIGIQAFAHFIPTLSGKENAFARQINSPASRQMLARHYNNADGSVRQDPMRTQFLADLERLGSWPRIPRLIAVANGTGDGTGLNVPPGEMALKSTGAIAFPGTTFYTQAAGANVTVAELKRLLPLASKTVKTSALPELDGAPGGTLDSYQIIAKALQDKGGRTDLRHPAVCFVPSVSAVAIRDIDSHDNLYAKIDGLDPDESDLDEYRCSSTTTAHTQITAELCEWIMERLPR